ncbi:unnamed protein product [Lepeophtheirus salmonis]|uniref:(salmon louse) hypothetical protein n=1 Tax=Lepeophtheirus salmonis TaxID=72036 RepID=A0A7R8CSQ8_LEPSM|nr:unnamed protein product [Lepeophtheirus salmonis]CAF2917119.1 unnamed protein product [Lepeophtheirus salmonis]
MDIINFIDISHSVNGVDFLCYFDLLPDVRRSRLIDGFTKLSAEFTAEIRHLTFISEFTNDIRYVQGVANKVADALSSPFFHVVTKVDFNALTNLQEEDEELMTHTSHVSSLKLECQQSLSRIYIITFDVSTGTARSFVPTGMRLKDRFVWPAMKKDIRQWCKECVQCQKSSIARHTKLALDNFSNVMENSKRSIWIFKWHGGATALPTASNWIVSLLHVFLGILSTLKEDIGYLASHLVYGTSLRLPGQIFEDTTTNTVTDISRFEDPNGSQIFIRSPPITKALDSSYLGPFRVIEPTVKTLKIDKDGKHETISINHVNPSFIPSELRLTTNSKAPGRTTSSARRVKFTSRLKD